MKVRSRRTGLSPILSTSIKQQGCLFRFSAPNESRSVATPNTSHLAVHDRIYDRLHALNPQLTVSYDFSIRTLLLVRVTLQKKQLVSSCQHISEH